MIRMEGLLRILGGAYVWLLRLGMERFGQYTFYSNVYTSIYTDKYGGLLSHMTLEH